MNNKNKLIIIILIVIISIFALGTYIYFKYKSYNKIPGNYVAMFKGGSGEIINTTYIYKIQNGQANYGYEYINVTSHTQSWGSSKWETNITGKGEVAWTDDVFIVAEKNGAYNYVVVPNSNDIYTIEEFMNMFLMN